MAKSGINMNSPIPPNELAQWTFMAVTVAVGIITFIAMRHQITLNRKQIRALEEQERKDHPTKG